MPELQNQAMVDQTFLKKFYSEKTQPKLFCLFKKGLSAGILSPQDIFGALPVTARKDKEAANEILDWLFDCLEQLKIKIISEDLRRPVLKLKNNTDSSIDILVSSTPEEENAEKILGPVMFSLFKALAISKKNGDKQKEFELRNKIVTLNIGLAGDIASHYRTCTINTSIEEGDLFQEGAIGLMRAIDLFEYLRGFRFSTYSRYWIKQHIQRFLDDNKHTVRIPVHKWGEIRKFIAATQKLTQFLQREPSEEELQKKLKWAPEEFKAVMDAIRVNNIISLDNPPNDSDPDSEGEKSLIEVISLDEKELEVVTEKRQFKERVNKILIRNQLPIREMYCFNEYIFSKRTYEEIGNDLKLSRERIRQLIERVKQIICRPKNLEMLKDVIEFSDTLKFKVALITILRKGPKIETKRKVRELLRENIFYLDIIPEKQLECLKRYFAVSGPYESFKEISRKLSINQNQVYQFIFKGLNRLPKFIQEKIFAILKNSEESLS